MLINYGQRIKRRVSDSTIIPLFFLLQMFLHPGEILYVWNGETNYEHQIQSSS